MSLCAANISSTSYNNDHHIPSEDGYGCNIEHIERALQGTQILRTDLPFTMNTFPKQSKIRLTLHDPAPAEHVTVRTQKLDAPCDVSRDGAAEPDPDDDIIDNMASFKHLIPKTKEAGAAKRAYWFDDRMLAMLLIYWKLGKRVGPEEPGYWSKKALGCLPQFYENGKLNPHSGHRGQPAWVYVDGEPRLLLANSMYALKGTFHHDDNVRCYFNEEAYQLFDGSSAASDDDATKPLFSVSEQAFPLDLIHDSMPIDQMLGLIQPDYIKLFVEPRSVRKAHDQVAVEQVLSRCREYASTQKSPRVVHVQISEPAPQREPTLRRVKKQFSLVRRAPKDSPLPAPQKRCPTLEERLAERRNEMRK